MICLVLLALRDPLFSITLAWPLIQIAPTFKPLPLLNHRGFVGLRATADRTPQRIYVFALEKKVMLWLSSNLGHQTWGMIFTKAPKLPTAPY